METFRIPGPEYLPHELPQPVVALDENEMIDTVGEWRGRRWMILSQEKDHEKPGERWHRLVIRLDGKMLADVTVHERPETDDMLVEAVEIAFALLWSGMRAIVLHEGKAQREEGAPL